MASEFIDINNTIIDFGHSLGLKVWTHNCRGNYDSRNMGGGSYLKIANLFLKQLKYDRFFLEWDDDRAGSLEALAVFQEKPNTEIVLGLLSSKTNTLDDEARVLRLLDEASQIIPKERLLLSHQCGFASCDGGNELTEDEQWAKIDQGQKSLCSTGANDCRGFCPISAVAAVLYDCTNMKLKRLRSLSQ